MTQEALFVFVLIGLAGAMMASNRVRYDLVAIIVVLALIIGDILPVSTALSGFGSSVVIMVAGLLVVGEMLERTGVARAVGDLILRHGGKDEIRLLLLLMLACAILGCVMSSTAVVAIFIPIVLRIAADTGIAQSRLLLPMSYAALISGMLTLIATPPNLVVSDGLADQGYAPLGFFSFLPVGAVVLVAAMVYCVLVARSALGQKSHAVAGAVERPVRTIAGLATRYEVQTHVHVVDIRHRPDIEPDFSASGVRILARGRGVRRGRKLAIYAPGMELRAGDQLLVMGTAQDVGTITDADWCAGVQTIGRSQSEWLSVVGAADVMIHPESTLIGRTIMNIAFRTTYGLDVISVLRDGETLSDPLNTRLQANDRLLVAGAWKKLDALVARTHDFVLLGMPRERHEVAPAADRFAVALAILGGMVLLSVLNIVPVVVAVLLASTAAVLCRTLSADEAYRSIHWSSIVLVAGMLPLADALNHTGGSALIVNSLLDLAGEASPRVMMTFLFALTAGVGLILSNTATAVLVTPIAITTAETLGVSPYPLAITVLVAASAAFSTPVSSPVVTLVVAPGNYRFADFLKIGLPLTLVVGAITVLVTPWVFPF